MNNDEASTAVDDPRVAWPPATVSTMPTIIPTAVRDERPPPMAAGNAAGGRKK